MQGKLPPKLKDPGSFTIPCNIGETLCGKALCDLVASINLMPLSIFKKLGIGEVRPTTITLQLADRSICYPQGKIEDVLVKVDKFIFPADFIIMDFDADEETPILLGRPFLATGRTLIDVEKGELTMRVNGKQVVFNVLKALQYPEEEMANCSMISSWEGMIHRNLLKQTDFLTQELKKQEESIVPEEAHILENLLTEKELQDSAEEEPSFLELKQLPSHLQYAYLEGENKLPVVISTDLNLKILL